MIDDDSDDSEGDNNDDDDDTKWHKIAFWWRTDLNHYGENTQDEGDDDDGINDEDDDGYDGSTNLHVRLDDSSAYSG